MNLQHVTVFILLSLYIHVRIVKNSWIEINPDGGYKKILLAISSTATQSLTPLSVIEDFLGNVSKSLRSATRNRIYFSEVQVLLPRTWNHSFITDATFETYKQADIRLDTFNPVPHRGDLYTNQPRGCGERGDFIYLSPSVLEAWSKSRAKSTVQKFLQEWAKFRYGVSEEKGSSKSVFPNEYITSEGAKEETGCKSKSTVYSVMDDAEKKGTTFCDNEHNKFAPNRQNALCNTKSTWEIIKNNKDFKDFKDNNTKYNAFRKPKISFVRSVPMQVVFIIDPNLCNECFTKGSHMLVLTLRKFIYELPEDAVVGCIVAKENSEVMQFKTRTKLELVEDIKKCGKRNYNTQRNLANAVSRGLRMFQESSFIIGTIILISDGPNLDPTTTLKPMMQQKPVNLFLLTWTPYSYKLKYSTTDMQEFINNPTQNVWMDTRMNSTIDICDPSVRLQIEDAVALFLNKFSNEDFYPDKVKVYDDVANESSDTTHEINIPKHADLIYEHYFCVMTIDNTEVSLHINDQDYSLQVTKTDMLNLRSVRYTEVKSPTNNIKFKWSLSDRQTTASSVWMRTSPNFILTGQIQKETVSNKLAKLPPKLYAFCSCQEKIVAEITTENGESFTIELRDNGNGDPDVLLNDNIHSRYLINKEQEDQLYSIKIIAKNKNGNILARTNIGSFYVPSSNIATLPPNRIVDFHSDKIVDNYVNLKWTAPGGHLDYDEAESYYVKCSTSFQNLTDENFDEKTFFKLDITPQTSGNQESYNWTPPTNTDTHFCVIVSTDSDGNASEMSNIISVNKKAMESKSRFSPNIITGIVIGVLVFVIVIGICYYRRKITYVYTRTKRNCCGEKGLENRR